VQHDCTQMQHDQDSPGKTEGLSYVVFMQNANVQKQTAGRRQDFPFSWWKHHVGQSFCFAGTVLVVLHLGAVVLHLGGWRFLNEIS
jgi:hypothetical protein